MLFATHCIWPTSFALGPDIDTENDNTDANNNALADDINNQNEKDDYDEDENDEDDGIVEGPRVLAHVDLARTICEFWFVQGLILF